MTSGPIWVYFHQKSRVGPHSHLDVIYASTLKKLRFSWGVRKTFTAGNWVSGVDHPYRYLV